MINITDKKKCCGCAACIQKCPKHCITMHIDKDGFWYPVVDTSVCVNCHLCEKVCPYIQQGQEKIPRKVYAAYSKDEQIRELSSSGGIFSILALRILENKGIVVGAAFTNDWQVSMIAISNKNDIGRLRGSKYVQADTCDTFREVEKFLKGGKMVLYSGTPCQIKALKLFLRCSYDNLITIDVACHGVPSPGIWKEYLNDVIRTAQRDIGGGGTELSSLNLMSMIKGIKFREKSLGWRRFRIVFNMTDSICHGNKNFEISSIHRQNPYFNAFNSSLIIRPSCTSCPAKHGRSCSDITIADFWGIENVAPQMDDDKGVSLVLINTEKGEKLINSIDLNKVECCYSDALRYNAGLRENTTFHKKREEFFKGYREKASVVKYMQTLLQRNLLERASGFIKRKIGL